MNNIIFYVFRQIFVFWNDRGTARLIAVDRGYSIHNVLIYISFSLSLSLTLPLYFLSYNKLLYSVIKINYRKIIIYDSSNLKRIKCIYIFVNLKLAITKSPNHKIYIYIFHLFFGISPVCCTSIQFNSK